MMNAKSSIEQEFNKSVLLKIMQAARFLGKQGLPLRGHNESTEVFQGKVCQLLLLQAEKCPSMTEEEYISPAII